MLKVEFHCHTIYSKDSLTQPAALIKAARKKGLDRVIITDHNRIDGALAAQKLDPELIIIGEEIMTTEGEILAAFVQEHIPPYLTPQETIKRLRAQDAFISLSHPFDIFRRGHWDINQLREIAPLVDAIEVFNARCYTMQFNQQAAAFAQEHGLLGTVGSDAHTAMELGQASLTVEHFESGPQLKQVLATGQASTQLSSPLIRLTSRFAVVSKKMRLFKQP